MKLSRHTLVWIRPESRASVSAQITDGAIHAHVAAWLAADRPLVVARQPVTGQDFASVGAGRACPEPVEAARDCIFVRGHHPQGVRRGCKGLKPQQHTQGPLLQNQFLIGNGITDKISVGLALPPAQGKRRIALNVASRDIVRSTPPLLLADALIHASAEWQSALAELDATAKDIDLGLRVFGSLAWQALSGLPYLTPQSDIDLFWQPYSHAQLQQGVALLARWEHDSGLRADGEVLFGGSSAVSWREWATLKSGGDQRVLVKRQSSAELVDAQELLELLA